MSKICIKRAYEEASPGDGQRFLVDRLWPRGVKKEVLAIKGWLKDVAPSSALRRWFGHDPERWEKFQSRYHKELQSHPEMLAPLQEAADEGKVTLVYGARDELHNHALVLRNFLISLKEKKKPRSRPAIPKASHPKNK